MLSLSLLLSPLISLSCTHSAIQLSSHKVSSELLITAAQEHACACAQTEMFFVFFNAIKLCRLLKACPWAVALSVESDAGAPLSERSCLDVLIPCRTGAVFALYLCSDSLRLISSTYSKDVTAPLWTDYALRGSLFAFNPLLVLFLLLPFFCWITSETRYHHVLGFLWQRQQLGRLQCGCRCPQQRLLPGRPHGGAARLPALHHLSYPLHRWVSKTGEN